MRSEVRIALAARGGPGGGRRHRWYRVDPGDVPALLAERGLTVSTMGRSPDQDRLYFQAAGAAGTLAAACLDGAEPDPVPAPAA